MLNKTIIQGRLVRDPELTQVNGSIDICKFTVAWSEKYKETEKQLFQDCVTFRTTAKFVKDFFHKGSEIIVEGSLVTEKWQDKEGNNRTKNSLNVEKVNFCGPKTTPTEAAPNTASYSGNDFMPLNTDGEELPFN